MQFSSADVVQYQKHEGHFAVPLPGTETLWNESILGQPCTWSILLQAYVQNLASLDHPAAMYWVVTVEDREDFVRLHNHAWDRACRDHGQCQLQHHVVTRDSWRLLSRSLEKDSEKAPLDVGMLGVIAPELADCTVLTNQLYAGDPSRAQALMVQLLPTRGTTETGTAVQEDLSRSSTDERRDSVHQLDADEVPIDEHPFFRRFAELLPTGLAILDHTARAVFVNSNFYALTTHKGEDQSFKSWPRTIHPDDYDRVMEAYRSAFESQKPLRTEFRESSGLWRLLLLTPLGDDNLKHISLQEYGGFICSIVDITSEKSAELSHRKSAQEAEERKKQQERFIDMISHEIRNPLSAVLHCTEDIEDAIAGCVQSNREVAAVSIMEAVETIKLCIDHQQNIVNDVLSFSKLDSSLLALRLESAQPARQMAESLRMFEPEFRKQGIENGCKIDSSYSDLQVDWVMADLARINQVLVNLLTNAIKFTAKKQGPKSVLFSIGASIERPTSYPHKVVFFEKDETCQGDATPLLFSDEGKSVYITAAITDTGIGIDEEGQKRLFERFRQATPKTFEIYGGSGLGLNICRKICHIHGGEIGVSSRDGEGSTFAFFFKVTKTHPPCRDRSPCEDLGTRDMAGKMPICVRSETERAIDPHCNLERSLNEPLEEEARQTTFRTGHQRSKTSNCGIARRRLLACKQDLVANSEHEQTPAVGQVQSLGSIMKCSIKDQHANSAERTQPQQQLQAQHEVQHSYSIHCLLVEDNMINQRIVLRKLCAKGYRVTTANNGREAVDAVRAALRRPSHDPAVLDIVLMDQEMPVLNGTRATREIRELERVGQMLEIPILGVTANARIAQQEEMLAAGMNDIISKPYRLQDLVQKIELLVQFSGDRATDECNSATFTNTEAHASCIG